jgi:hypothetical protein
MNSLHRTLPGWRQLFARHIPAIVCGFTLLGAAAFVSSTSLAAGQSSASNEDKSDKEYTVKAAFLYNFIRFTKWPAPSDSEKESKPLVIGILGDNPFDAAAFNAVENKAIPSKNRKLVVKLLGDFKKNMDLTECGLLFVCSSERKNFDEIMKNAGKANILTVADTPGFADDGGMLNLVIKNRQVRWEINADAIKESSLQLNSQLYRSAVRVIGNGEKP